tara:strand:+ start:377 stop:1378 length:1002 start_codon:yes stop_codon:yes gene_type:complete
MANVKAYSSKQFSFLIAMQDDMGTLEPGGGNPYLAVDVDSVGTPSLNLNQVIEPRSGSRVLQATDFFQDNKNKVIEISVSGTATTEVLDMLLGNITQGDTVPYGIASSGDVSSFTSGTEDQTANQILSIMYKTPATGHGMAFKDCFCTALSLTGDAGTEGGRIKFSATFKTGTLPTLNQSDIAIDTAISQNNYFMRDWVSAQRVLAGITGVLVNNFTLNIENDVIFSGLTSTGFEHMARVSEVVANADFNVKYDDLTDVLIENFHDQVSGASEGALMMGTDGTPSDGEFEFKFANSIITNAALSEGDVMAVDVSVKAVGAGIGSSDLLFEISC